MPIKLRNTSLPLFCFLLFCVADTNAQMITGFWKGKVSANAGLLKSSYKLELKLVQKGDSLTGTSYYYISPSNYYRFKIKGYFNSENNTVVWWDDEMIEYSTNNKLFTPNEDAMVSEADFNCPGGGKMMLDGKSKKKEDEKEYSIHLDKTDGSNFKDEWDWLIDNYTFGANDPAIIDSVNHIASAPVALQEKQTVAINQPVEANKSITKTPPATPKKENVVKKEPTIIVPEKKEVTPPLTIEEKFQNRQKKVEQEIPLAGDSVELRFYDNAEIDGDSISLFLNNKLIFQHIKLSGEAYTIKLSVKELGVNNELTMVAENLGAIPPNTSYMLALVNNQRYEAVLTSTEQSSAVIRFIKKE